MAKKSGTVFATDSLPVLANMVANAMRDGLWEYDAAGHVFHYSMNYAGIFGPEGVEGGPGKPFRDWMAEVHPDDLRRVFGDWGRLLEEDRQYRLQYRIRDRLGNWRWIATTIYAVLNRADGTPERITGYHMDITEAMRTEQNLYDTKERLRMIVEHAGIGILMVNANGILEGVNPALCRMLGRDKEELVGRRLSEFAHSEDGREMERTRERLVRGECREISEERRMYRNDGETIWVGLTGTVSVGNVDGKLFIIAMVEDITAKRDMRTRLQFEATHDSLTGAWSRGVLLERLGQHINLALRHNEPMAFCLCDLDHFKEVNDRHGHQVGDQVLIGFVRHLQWSVRDTDIVGRYGGEEFGIVFPGTAIEGAAEAMQRARIGLFNHEFRNRENLVFRVTASFGLCGVRADSGLRGMLERADDALYQAKRAGRNRIEIAGRKPE